MIGVSDETPHSSVLMLNKGGIRLNEKRDRGLFDLLVSMGLSYLLVQSFGWGVVGFFFLFILLTLGRV